MAGLSDYLGVAAGAASAIPGIGGIASAALSGLGALFGAESDTEREVRASKELMQYQNRIAVENWNRQNEYNHPLKQMERLAAAGLNPHLVYGQGATTLAANLTQSSASAKGGKADYAGTGLAAAQNYAAVQNLVAQNDNLKAQNHLLEAQKSEVEEKTRGLMLDNSKKVREQPYWSNNAHLDNKIKQFNSKIQEEIAYQQHVDSEFKFDEKSWAVKQAEQRFYNLQQDEKVALADEALKIMQQLVGESQIKLNAALARQAVVSADYTSTLNFIKSFDKALVERGLDPELEGQWRMLGNIIVGIAGLIKPEWKEELKKLMYE